MFCDRQNKDMLKKEKLKRLTPMQAKQNLNGLYPVASDDDNYYPYYLRSCLSNDNLNWTDGLIMITVFWNVAP
jgi:hypothetical protein